MSILLIGVGDVGRGYYDQPVYAGADSYAPCDYCSRIGAKHGNCAGCGAPMQQAKTKSARNDSTPELAAA